MIGEFHEIMGDDCFCFGEKRCGELRFFRKSCSWDRFFGMKKSWNRKAEAGKHFDVIGEMKAMITRCEVNDITIDYHMAREMLEVSDKYIDYLLTEADNGKKFI